ncbi:MAG TPA: hypothetical protein EYO33_23915 [Phycisphaerales bacterium]|nr:hypothetical protein [Phycisphaerales bacterium]
MISLKISFSILGFLCLFNLAVAEPVESVESIRARFERQRGEIAQKLRTQKIELIKLMAVDSPNPDQCKKKLDQILSTERKRQYLFLDEMFAVRQGMSDEEWRDYRRSVIMMMMNKTGSK